MQQIADEIFLDLQIAPVNIRHPRQRVHVLNHFAFGIVDDFAVPVFEGESGNGGEVAAFGHFLAGEIEFLAADPVNGGRRFQRFRGQHHGVRADEADFGARLLRLDGLGHFAVVFQRRRGGVDDDVVEIFGDGEAFREVNAVRRAVEQARIGRERGGLGQPRWDTKSS